MHPICNTFQESSRHQIIQVQWRTFELKIEKHADRMSQDLANQTMSQMPQIIRRESAWVMRQQSLCFYGSCRFRIGGR